MSVLKMLVELEPIALRTKNGYNYLVLAPCNKCKGSGCEKCEFTGRRLYQSCPKCNGMNRTIDGIEPVCIPCSLCGGWNTMPMKLKI